MPDRHPPHVDGDALGRSIAGLTARNVRAPAGGGDAVAAVVRAAAEIFAVSGVGLLLISDDQILRYVAASDARAAELELAQEELGVGPCVDSFVHEELVTTTDLLEDPRWPALGARLAAHGVRAVMGTPTHLGATVVGSLNVYRDAPYAWDDSDVEAVAAYNRVIEHQLASALVADRQDALIAQLQHALEHRVQIERAIGMVMAHDGGDPVAAFNRLRGTARAERRRVAEVAAEVLSGRRLA
ncbi:MAG: GAF and ANTAR domain-containing protein [Thermoleophilia bacterium]|nr:GAF and ANTAR domain-containing protein [Thermoleophilia bacterium]